MSMASINMSTNDPNASASGKPQTQTDPFLTNDFYPLNQAHNAVLAALRADESAPDADLYRRIASTSASISDVQGNLYRTAQSADFPRGNGTGGVAQAPGVGGTGTGTGMGSMGSMGINMGIMTQAKSSEGHVYNTLDHSSSIPLPPYLTNIIKETKLSSLMGILPEGNMVWVSVDDSLYLWEYGSLNGGRKKEDFVCFQVPSGQCVVSVGIVKPKPGVFKDIVEWCLVVTTPEEAIICALAREFVGANMGMNMNGHGNGNGNMHPAISDDSHLVLIPTRYEIPTDSVPLLSICGTDDGRVFMGGYDGSLYEMSYEPNVNVRMPQNGRFYNDEDFTHDYDYGNGNGYDTASLTSTIAATGKRALSTLVFGPTSPSEMRSRKCRKVNHSSIATPIVSAIIPGFVLKASSMVFGSNPSSAGGPIVNLTLDKDRKTMYALTARGFVHAYDLDTNTKPKNGFGSRTGAPKLACSVNVTKSVRRYLESVSHGRTYPPSHTGSESVVASINFTGGASGAQAGVGGMDGARSILKIANAEVMRKKSEARSGNRSRSNVKSMSEGCLHPISIHIVPAAESKFLTLVVIATGGLRYYFSVLPDAGNSYGSNSVRPGRRFTLCHVRAPPPFYVNEGHDVTLDQKLMNTKVAIPAMLNRGGDLKGRTTKGCYVSGVTVLAIDCDQESNNEQSGDSILALTPDYIQRVNGSNKSNVGQSLVPYSNTATGNGVNEIVSQPMTANKLSSVGASILPGGHVWELNVKTLNMGETESVMRLFSKSTTPPTMSQSDNLMAAYLPPSASRRQMVRGRASGGKIPSKTSLDTAANTSEAIIAPSSGLTGLIRSILTGKKWSVNGPPRMPQSQMNSYRVSSRFGCDHVGFSVPPTPKSSLGRGLRGASVKQSARLPSTVLNPPSAPLPELAMQHLMVGSKRKGVLALNSGGLHYFTKSSPIDRLQVLLSKSVVGNIANDEDVKLFFKSYGYSEGCAMCLAIAISTSDDAVVKKAVRAALSYARRPRLVRSIQSGVNNSGQSVAGIQSILPPNQISGFEGYTFNPSSLHDGLISLTSRLLRPIWCKPALVVTEGKTIPPKRKGDKSVHLPARVELLLDQRSLEEIRRPLAALQSRMRDVFGRAIDNVPGANGGDTEMIDTSGYVGSNLISQSVQYQNQARFQNGSRDQQQPSDKELNAAACQNEERNIHAIYRLVSRTVQLLTLLDHLYRAHYSPSLPEVEFGLLHGLTFSQLVTLKSAQDRVETTLTNLFNYSTVLSEHQIGPAMLSGESDNLCNKLSEQCYLYFSLGARLTFLGFRNAEAALSSTSLSAQNEHIVAASGYLREASKHWHNISHVTGQLPDVEKPSSTNRNRNAYVEYNELALRALENGSSLAKAASTLMEFNDVAAVVDICLTCAKNFDSAAFAETEDLLANGQPLTESMLPWERSLYHRHLNEPNSNVTPGVLTSRDIASMSKETTDAAKRTCHALLYYLLDKLLESALHDQADNNLVERMLSIATSSPDLSFIHGLYEYLASSGHVETLLRIDSSSLENWLELNSTDFELLWRYYTFHNIHWMAGQVMWNHGNSMPENRVPIETRIECLTRALGSYSNALDYLGNDSALVQYRIASRNSASSDSLSQRYGTSPSWDELSRVKNQINEQIDIAKIQTRVLTTIKSSANAKNVDESQILELKTSLVDISKLYNEYAAPLGLYDICLAIFQTCNYYEDESMITKLWRSILCEEILPCRTSNEAVQKFLETLKRDSMLEEESVVLSNAPVTKENGEPLMTFEDGEWITNIKSRVVDLGRELQGRGPRFPLHFIVECLEGLYRAFDKCTEAKSDHWPVQVLIEAGAPYASILKAYNSLLSSRNENSNASLKLEQLFNIGDVLKLWITSASSSSSRNPHSGSMNDPDVNKTQLAQYSSDILSQIDNYKAELESLVGCNSDDVSRCYALFHDIEKTLRRGW